jgi:hypothetical protein
MMAIYDSPKKGTIYETSDDEAFSRGQTYLMMQRRSSPLTQALRLMRFSERRGQKADGGIHLVQCTTKGIGDKFISLAEESMRRDSGHNSNYEIVKWKIPSTKVPSTLSRSI